MTIKQLIKEYVDDHYKHFGFYPYEAVEWDSLNSVSVTKTKLAYIQSMCTS